MGEMLPTPLQSQYYLPDFCNVRTVLYVVILGELLAFMLTLRPFDSQPGDWTDLSLISLFIQWVALTCAWLLCISRRRLQTLAVKHITLWAAVIIVGVTLLFTEIAIWLPWHIGLSSNPPDGWHWSITLRNLAVAIMVTLASLRYFYLQYQWHQQIRAETRARLDALQARIRPHFLFNSMNTIASLIRSQPEEAEAAVEDLADLFRHNLTDLATLVPLEQELDITRRYIHMEQLRLGDRLTVDWRLARLPADIQVPVLTLQPLVENAIYHGIEPLAQGGTISIQIQVQNGILSMTVDNPIAATTVVGHHGNGMALDNIRLRLQALYGTKSKVELAPHAGSFQVTLSFPGEPNAS